MKLLLFLVRYMEIRNRKSLFQLLLKEMRKDNLMSLHISKQEYTLIYRTKKHMRLNMKNFLEIFMRSYSLLNLN